MKSRVSGFSRAKLEAGKNGLGLEMNPKVVAVCFQGLARRSCRVMYSDHVIFHSCHPYIERLLYMEQCSKLFTMVAHPCSPNCIYLCCFFHQVSALLDKNLRDIFVDDIKEEYDDVRQDYNESMQVGMYQVFKLH